MYLRLISDWTLLPGARVEIRQLGTRVSSGHVDTVTHDGKILWLQPVAGSRRMFEKAEFYEVWAAENRPAFHYEVTRITASAGKIAEENSRVLEAAPKSQRKSGQWPGSGSR